MLMLMSLSCRYFTVTARPSRQDMLSRSPFIHRPPPFGFVGFRLIFDDSAHAMPSVEESRDAVQRKIIMMRYFIYDYASVILPDIYAFSSEQPCARPPAAIWRLITLHAMLLPAAAAFQCRRCPRRSSASSLASQRC
jgi:hypothetical protein